MIFERPCSAQLLRDGGPIALGQMVEHVAFLVHTAVHERLAEDRADRL